MKVKITITPEENDDPEAFAGRAEAIMRDIFYATPKVKSLIKTEKDGVVTIISHGTVDAATPPLEIC